MAVLASSFSPDTLSQILFTPSFYQLFSMPPPRIRPRDRSVFRRQGSDYNNIPNTPCIGTEEDTFVYVNGSVVVGLGLQNTCPNNTPGSVSDYGTSFNACNATNVSISWNTLTQENYTWPTDNLALYANTTMPAALFQCLASHLNAQISEINDWSTGEIVFASVVGGILVITIVSTILVLRR